MIPPPCCGSDAVKMSYVIKKQQSDADTVVPKERHSDVFAAKMRSLGRNLQYVVVPGYGHGDGEVAQEYYEQTLKFMSLEG